jgi:hypothetical protein
MALMGTALMVTVTITSSAFLNYWLTPQGMEDITGLGIELPQMIHGSSSPGADGSSTLTSISLNESFAWDVNIELRGVPPIRFEGLRFSAGGDLLELLAAQGWTPLS